MQLRFEASHTCAVSDMCHGASDPCGLDMALEFIIMNESWLAAYELRGNVVSSICIIADQRNNVAVLLDYPVQLLIYLLLAQPLGACKVQRMMRRSRRA